MDWLIQLAGAGLIGLALWDLYTSVLYSRGGNGSLMRRVNGGYWRLLKMAAKAAGGRQADVLAHGGSLMIVLDVVVWGLLLVLGFALIIWPELGNGVQTSGPGPTPTDFLTAVYYAGYSLTTLGTGDIVPRTGAFRVLMVVKAALGFSFITLTLTYVMSVYSALHWRNSFALSLHHRTADTGDAGEYLARLLARPSAAAEQDLRELASSLCSYYEAHHFYPILHFFRFPSTHYSMGRILYVVLDAATLVRTALDERQYAWLMRSSAVESLWRSGMYLLEYLPSEFLPAGLRRSAAERKDRERPDWEEHYRAAVARLQDFDIACTDDLEEGFQRYAAMREEWNDAVYALCIFMQYDWSEVAGVGPARELRRRSDRPVSPK